uniref:Uncharacterized protein n=1 Tax=Tanacetum cinerariifolium TaxID=118510 RepID=A0A6L2NFK1_TANCI|nr:hypothetical protein [Tanacetum cinerariifolium]
MVTLMENVGHDKFMKKQHGEKSETRYSGHEDHVSEITPPSTPTPRLGGIVNSSHKDHVSEITPPSTPITPPSAPRLNWICQTTPGAPMQKAPPTHKYHVSKITSTLITIIHELCYGIGKIMAPPPLAIERVPLRYWEPL